MIHVKTSPQLKSRASDLDYVSIYYSNNWMLSTGSFRIFDGNIDLLSEFLCDFVSFLKK